MNTIIAEVAHYLHNYDKNGAIELSRRSLKLHGSATKQQVDSAAGQPLSKIAVSLTQRKLALKRLDFFDPYKEAFFVPISTNSASIFIGSKKSESRFFEGDASKRYANFKLKLY